MAKHKQILRFLSALACCAGCCLMGGYLIPLMQSVQIGRAGAEGLTADSAPAKLPSSPAVHLIERTELLAPAVSDDESNIISYESEGSKAMWRAMRYRNAHGSDGGAITEKQYSGLNGNMFFSLPGGGQVRNSTFWSNSDLLAESKILPDLNLKTDGTPMVLIYHTHTTESYQDTDSSFYDAKFNFRTTEPDKNMVAVGDAIAQELSAAGIGVIHAGEIHDYPQWNGSYSRSAVTVRDVLAKYPSVQIALDIHRDAISSGSTVIAPTVTVNGQKSAQIMIISGCDDGTMNLQNYRKNFHLACQIQQHAETMFPGLTRPILFDYRKYNQDLTNGSLLIEVGSQGNSLDEAVLAGHLTGQALAETIRSLAAGNHAEGEISE